MANYQIVTPVQLGQAAMTTSYAVLYTVPASTRTYVKQLDICNTGAAPINVYVSLVPSAGSASTANAIFYNTPVAGFTTVSWFGTQIMNASGTIQVKASATGVTITASGGEAT
jgi:hypothetical protein